MDSNEAGREWVDRDYQRLTGEQRDLAVAMSDLSETAWAAGWNRGAEYDIWRLLQEGGSWGMFACDLGEPDPDIERIRRMQKYAGCWIIWDDGARAVFLDDWEPRYQEWATERRRALRERIRAAAEPVVAE